MGNSNKIVRILVASGAVFESCRREQSTLISLLSSLGGSLGIIFNLTINGSNGVVRRGLYGTVPAGNGSEEVFNGSRHCILHVMVVVALVEWDLKIIW